MNKIISALLCTTLLSVSAWATGPMRNYITLPSGQQVALPMPQTGCPSCLYHAQQLGGVTARAFDTLDPSGTGIYGQSAKGSVPSVGDIRIPVIMVSFADVAFQEYSTKEKVSRLFNEEGYADVESAAYGVKSSGSVRDYFTQNSGGMFRPQFDVVANVQVSGKRADYGGNTGKAGSDKNVPGLVNEAIQLAANAGTDFTPYATDADGVPLVIIFFAGPGEHASMAADAADYIWPHFRASSRTVNSTKFKSYYVGNELFQIYQPAADYATTGNVELVQECTAGIGVLIHELMHALGLPDFYDTQKEKHTTVTETPDYWSVMDYGQYQVNGYRPMQTSAYERSCLGWLQLKEIPATGSFTIHPNEAYIVRNAEDTKSFYILEPRAPHNWYVDSRFGRGMLVWEINYNASLWNSNTPNNDASTIGVRVLPADGAWQTATAPDFSSPADYAKFRGDLFPGDSNNAAAQTHTTLTLFEQSLFNIRIASDGGIALDQDPDGIITPTHIGGAQGKVELNPWIYIQNNRKYLKH